MPRSKTVQSIATEGRLYTILAIDHGRALGRIVGLAGGDSADGQMRFKRVVLDLLARYCSAVLISADLLPTVGHDWTPPAQTGLIVALDAPDYDESTCPPLIAPPSELFERIVDAGAHAAKVVVYYDPRLPDAVDQHAAVLRIVALCQAHNLPLVLEPLPPPQSRGVANSPWPVVTVARQLASTGASLLKLPLISLPGPENEELCSQITAASNTVPWVLLSAGMPFSDFLGNLRLALAGGASGFAAGRSIWGDLAMAPESDATRQDTVDRLLRAVALTKSFGGRGAL